MPRTAHAIRDDAEVVPASTRGASTGALYGSVGEMHRAIEERWLAGNQCLAVIPLPFRPSDRLMALASRATGWVALVAATGLALRILA